MNLMFGDQLLNFFSEETNTRQFFKKQNFGNYSNYFKGFPFDYHEIINFKFLLNVFTFCSNNFLSLYKEKPIQEIFHQESPELFKIDIFEKDSSLHSKFPAKHTLEKWKNNQINLSVENYYLFVCLFYLLNIFE